MNWLIELFTNQSLAGAILIYSFVIFLGVGIGKIKIFGISIGIAGVLFAGIAASHFGFSVEQSALNFAKEFGLVLFVYHIGLQVGPGFFASLKKEGLSLNILAGSIVILGAAITIAIYFIANIPLSIAVGILSGAVTNTPGLGAAQQALYDLRESGVISDFQSPGVGYAIAYPFGVIGIISSIVLIKNFFKINTKEEIVSLEKKREKIQPTPIILNLTVSNPQVIGKTIKEIFSTIKSDVVVSRVRQGDNTYAPSQDTVLHSGDIIVIVGREEDINKFKYIIGDESLVKINLSHDVLVSKRAIVTKSDVTGKTLAQLDLRNKFGVNLTRIYRAGVQFLPKRNSMLQFGDYVTIVGAPESVDKATQFLGDSVKKLNEPNLIPVFVGIALGVLVGSVPIALPGAPAAIKLGLAGGPLIVAIILSRIGQIGKFSTYVSQSANLTIREIGITLFLASVGLASGAGFYETLTNGDGLNWALYGAVITLFPILLIGAAARKIFKKNYLEICGLLAGSMTDPPALAFASNSTDSEYPAVAYAAVYPLTTFLRILTAQLIVLALAG